MIDWNKIYLALLKVTKDESQAVDAMYYLMLMEHEL